MSSLTKIWLSDASERVAWTFVQAFLAVWVVADTSTIKTAAIAGVAAVAAAIKAVAARKVGMPFDASTLR